MTMVKKLLACTLLTILGLSLTSAVGGPEPLPQDLRTETLLVLLFDRAPDNLRGAKKHNELIDELNRKTLEELKKYPYPSATMARSKYEKNEDVPEHRYMLNGIIAKKFNDGEIVDHLGSRLCF
jgi:hypothetical protein